MPPQNQNPAVPNPPGFYPPQPAPVVPAAPDPNEPPAWAKTLIDGQAELKQTYAGLEARLDGMGEIDPGNPDPQPPAPVLPGQADPNDPYANYKPTSWSDIPKTAQQIAESTVDAKLAARDAAAEAARAESALARTAVDRQLDEAEQRLTASNFLPPVVNPNDPNDPGRLAKRELYGVAQSLNTTDLEAVSRQISAMHEAGRYYDVQTGSWLNKNSVPAGAYAPVGASGGGVGPGAAPVTYKQIHGSSMHDLAASRGLQ